MKCYKEKIEVDAVIPAQIYFGKSQGNKDHYPLHWHNHLEFDLVLEGTISGRISGKHIEVHQGEFLFVNSGELHETYGNHQHEMNAIILLLSDKLLKEYCPNMDMYYFDFGDKEDVKHQIKDLIIQCAHLYEEKKPFYELDLSIALRRICRLLLTECRCERLDTAYSRYEEKNLTSIKKAIDYMEKHYEDLIPLNTIAEEIGISPNYFSKLFKQTTGETFHTYLRKIRLYNAKNELMNCDASITEIALNNGFPNVKSFISAFKSNYEITPAKFRRINW